MTHRCEDTDHCRFYYWHPIDYSPAPNYCYLFRSCEGAANEPHVAMIAAGRHPGYYFMKQTETLDIIRASAVCDKTIEPNETQIGRAGAVSDWVTKIVFVLQVMP